jgi:hypothetical protein
MAGTPLIIGATQKAKLAALRKRALADPIDMQAAQTTLSTEEGRIAHWRRMNALTIPIPVAFEVTFSVETGHPSGTMRHMSMSSGRRGRSPTPEAVWMICEELGFVGSLEQCAFWFEDLKNGDKAVNVVQPVAIGEGGRA